MHDLIAELDRARRAVHGADLHNAPGHVVELRRRLRAPVAEAWEACTAPGRVGRWFLPLGGDLRLGGHFQLEGNAGGTITVCEPPRRLQLTWEFGDAEPSSVALELTSAGDDATEVVLRHTVPNDDAWTQYGPGAVGVAWDLHMVALANFVVGNDLPKGEEFMADPRMPDVMRHSAALRGVAHEAGGASAEAARDAAARSSAFYAPQGQPKPT